MEVRTKIFFLDENREKFFGEGPYRLLRAVGETGSLRAAALSMGISYTKALRMISHGEQALGFPLTRKTVGGKSGGGSVLTPEGTAWLARYEGYRDACIAENQKLFARFFPEQVGEKTGCVIMASGLGKRFGCNKLLADFGGKPLIQWALDATEGLFPRRVVVTRHPEVEALCREQGIECIFHALPHRSDTVRLGIEAVERGVERCMFLPGDQPLLRRETVAALLQCASGSPSHIWRTRCRGVEGSPVIFPQALFSQLANLPQTTGGRAVIQSNPGLVRFLEVENAAELADIDTPADFERLAALLPG